MIGQPTSNARVTVTSLTNTAQSIFAATAGATGNILVNGIIVNGGAAAEIVIFRAEDDSPEYFRISVPIGDTKYIEFRTPLAISALDGMEALTASAAGDVEVTVFYWQPGAAGVGV